MEIYTLDEVPLAERAERWESLLSDTHADMSVRLSTERPPRPFRASVRRLWIDDLALVDAECDPCSGTRGRARIAATDGDYLCVSIIRSGLESVAQGDADREMRPGDIMVWDSRLPARWAVREPLSKRSLLIPLAALDEVSGQRWTAGGVVLDGRSPAAHLLTSYLDILAGTVPRLPPAAVSAARNATLELLVGAVRPAGGVMDTATATPALRELMDAWIDRNLATGPISPAMIAAAHGVSVRTVYRVFEAAGEAVAAVVRVRRLARARTELTSGNVAIAVIARHCGYPDPSHFSRTFKAHYGCSPGDYRADSRSLLQVAGNGRGLASAFLSTSVASRQDRTGPARRGRASGRSRRIAMAREDIEFAAEGVTLRGWFYPADGAAEEAPCVVLQHGFAAVKEMWLDRYAEIFQAAGLSCVVYDHPGFGASDAAPGAPRQEIDPWTQIRFIQHAITYAQSRSDVDSDRIGLWGSSYAGAHAYVTAAIDRRIKAVVGQVPLISGSTSFGQLVRIDNWAMMDALFAQERQARMAGAEPTLIPVVDKDPTATSALPTPDSYIWFTTTAADRAPAFRNEVTLLSLEFFRGYEPGKWIPLISPTPLLMVVAPNDRLAAGELAAAAYETAAHPKRIQVVEGGHFDAYTGSGFEVSSAAARDWFADHLRAEI